MPRKPIDFIIISNTMLVKNLLVLMFLLCSKQASATFRTSCLNPSRPLNGRVTMTRSLFGYQKAIYSCKTGYKLVGMQTRSCFNGIWSGYRPICQLLSKWAILSKVNLMAKHLASYLQYLISRQSI